VQFRHFGLYRDLEDIEEYRDRVALFEQLSHRNVDGIYQVTIDGQRCVMAVARSGGADIAVSVAYGFLNLTMNHGRFDRQTQEIQVSNAAPANPLATLSDYRHIQFRVTNSGAIEGVLDTGAIRLPFTGERTGVIPNFMASTPGPGLISLSGTYRGDSADPLLKTVELKVYRHGGRYAGILVFNADVMPISVTMGHSWHDHRSGALYLTGYGTANGKSLHLRGTIDEEGFTGVYVSTQGLKPIELKLKRIR